MRRPISAQTAKRFLTVHIRSNGCHHFLMVYNLLSRLQTLTLLLFPQTRQPASASTSCRARSHLPRPSPSLQITRRQPPHLPPTDPQPPDRPQGQQLRPPRTQIRWHGLTPRRSCAAVTSVVRGSGDARARQLSVV